MNLRFLLLTAFAAIVPCASVFGWGEPHLAITRAALEVLPPWQKELLGTEFTPLGENYCLIPDHVYTDRANARFAMMDSRPRDVYLLNLHLPALQQENLETLRYFLDKAVAALRAKDVAAAARFMGTICHQIEDYGSPAHTVPGDNMFTLLQQFLPPSEAMKDQLLHSPIENGELPVTIAGYEPRLLGATVEEASWRLLHRIHEGIRNARSTTIPIIQALYAGDDAAVKAAQMKAATVDAQISADALHTILCLGAERFAPDAMRALEQAPIGALWPLEAENLYYPQKQFFSAPNWGFPHSGVILAEGKKAQPLALRVAAGREEPQEFTNGISAGMGKTLTFLLPRGVYRRFTVLAGLHPQLGANGKVEFAIAGDDRALGSAVVSGTEPAHAFECEIGEVEKLQLTLISRGEAKSQYAIWAEPVLWKK
jgi:hypothetical protein